MKKINLTILLIFFTNFSFGQTEIKANNENSVARLNKPLISLLDSIYNQDQTDRRNIDPIQKQFGWESKQMDSLWRKIDFQDSVNLEKVKNIIDTYGWLGADEIGERGATTLFLVIQHADSLTQINYVPKMREAVKNGKARPYNLALLEDRILTTQGIKQIYGSQVRQNETTGKNEFFPIDDEINVNKRRALVGLNSIEEYAKQCGIEYMSPQNKKFKKK